MIEVVTHLKSASPYGQSKMVRTPKKEKETSKDYEERTWRDRCHCDEKGEVYIPAISFKKCITEAAQYLSLQIPGKGKATYTKHFRSGLFVPNLMPLGVRKDKIDGFLKDVPADGKPGGSKRVDKMFPYVNTWEWDVTWYILDETITKDIFVYILSQSGKFIGLGYWRPARDGYWGRFDLSEVVWDGKRLDVKKILESKY